MELTFEKVWNNVSVLSLLFTALCLLFAFYTYRILKRKSLPPGPIGFPFIGYVFSLGTNPGKTFMDLKNKYGSMVTVTLGNDDWIVLNDYDIIEEAYVKQGTIFSGRPHNNYAERFTKGGLGIICSDGEKWKTLRKFGNRTLRLLGMGENRLESAVTKEAYSIVDHLSADNGITLQSLIAMGTVNIMSGMVVGSRYDYSNKKFQKMIEILKKFFSDSNVGKVIGLAIFCPVVRFLPYFRSEINDQLSRYDVLLDIYRGEIDKHKKKYNADDPKDLIDFYLAEPKQKQNENVFFDENFAHFVRDMFDAGFGTTSNAIIWSILALAHYPECEKKILSEINKSIGSNGIPSMKHQESMPYTCAFIQEILRHRTIVPIGLVRCTTQKTVLGGYTLKKNTKVISNVWAVHHDSKNFPDPEVFKPERFIDSAGKFVKPKRVIPFSLGPRRCLGENLAYMEIFLFLTTIVQKLEIRPIPGKPLPPFAEGMFNGVAYASFEFELDFKKR